MQAAVGPQDALAQPGGGGGEGAVAGPQGAVAHPEEGGVAGAVAGLRRFLNLAVEEWSRAHKAGSLAREEELVVEHLSKEREREEREGLALLREACSLAQEEELAAEERSRTQKTRSLAQEEELATDAHSRKLEG